MFEKEAEEYLDTESKYLIEDNEGNIINIAKKVKQSFQDGAEFGYNKTKEIIKELIDDWMSMEGDEIRELKSVKEAEELLQSLSK